MADDWYVEPAWCVDILLDRVAFPHGLHDPCCGLGTIPLAARARGQAATGADLRQRAEGWSARDFFSDLALRPSIVTNPPYNIAVRIIEHALSITRRGGSVCALAIRWLGI